MSARSDVQNPSILQSGHVKIFPKASDRQRVRDMYSCGHDCRVKKRSRRVEKILMLDVFAIFNLLWDLKVGYINRLNYQLRVCFVAKRKFHEI
jgi:hypothetical protein